MKKNACLIVGFLAFICLSGQSPRKEMHEITTNVEPEQKEMQVESARVEEEVVRKSAAQKVREGRNETTLIPKGAAKKAIEAEENFFSN